MHLKEESMVVCAKCGPWYQALKVIAHYSIFFFFFLSTQAPPQTINYSFHLLASATMSMTGHTPTETNHI